MGQLEPQRRILDNDSEGRDDAPFRVSDTQDKATTENAQGVERERRDSTHSRRSSKRAGRLSDKSAKFRIHVLPKDWWTIALLIVIIVPIGVIVSQSLPPWQVGLGTAIGVIISYSARAIAKRERIREQSNLIVIGAAWVSIIIPMICIGLNLSIWAINGDLDWRWAVAGLVSTNAVCASLLSRRTVQQFVAHFVCWLPVALLDGNMSSYLGIVVATIAMALVGYRQSIVTKKRNEIRLARERERNRAEDILRDYEDTGQGWFWETDRRGLLTYLSPSVIKVLQKPENEIIGFDFVDLFDLSDNDQNSERTLAFHLSSRSSFQELGVQSAAPGEERWWSINGRPAYDSFHNFIGFRGSGTDLTEKKRSEENVNRLAQFDSLTGLANRFQIQQTLQKILASPFEQHRECSVFLLDLDRFKHVNDTLGHPAGDALLKQVAQRLLRVVDKNGQVGRLGGDEFNVIIPGRVPRVRMEQLAHEIIHTLSQPYSIAGQSVVIGASIGIAIAPEDGESSEALFRNSDLALYAAKDGGRGRYHFYSHDLHSAAEERSKLEEDLRDAIAQGGLELQYQPVICAKDETIAGFEALLRWNHPTKGWLSPAIFIPIAEDTGLIPAIGDWAIRTACTDMANWPQNVRCAVNVSPLQFSNPQLPSIITNAIARTGIEPSRLELEITESVFLNDDDGTDAMFTALKRVGVRLALDDFGTGYSSLGYLKKAPFDKIKIDQSFVRGATEPGSRNGAIITSITSLAKALGMDTTAEGVETMDELELVRSLGCSHVQGYIYSKAISSEEVVARLKQSNQMIANGPRSARTHRPSMLRKVVLRHGDHLYDAKIRNIASGGTMIEGLCNVPVGTEFKVVLSDKVTVSAKTIWSEGDRIGVQFVEHIDFQKIDMKRPTSINPDIKKAERQQA